MHTLLLHSFTECTVFSLIYISDKMKIVSLPSTEPRSFFM